MLKMEEFTEEFTEEIKVVAPTRYGLEDLSCLP